MLIKKADLARYLKQQALPLFGEGWGIYDGHILLRRNGILLQGVYFDRAGHGDFLTVRIFVMVAAIPKGEDFGISLTIGDYVLDSHGHPIRFPFTSGDKPKPDNLYHLCIQQGCPPLTEPLTLESMDNYLEQGWPSRFSFGTLLSARNRIHFSVLWTRGIITGLLGNLTQARIWLQECEKNIDNHIKGWKKKNSEPPNYLLVALKGLQSMMAVLDTQIPQDFQRYCDEIAARNLSQLKLPV